MTTEPAESVRLAALLVVICVASAWNAAAMSPEQIDRAIVTGQQAAKEKDVPGAITIGRNKPTGDYLFELFVSRYTRTTEYVYMATTCEMWVPWMAFVAEQNSAVIDRPFIDDWCLGKDLLAIAVVPESEAATAARAALLRVTFDGPPVTEVELLVDGKAVPPVDDSHFGDFGGGTGLLYYERSVLKYAATVEVVATIKDKPIGVRFKKKKLDLIRQEKP